MTRSPTVHCCDCTGADEKCVELGGYPMSILSTSLWTRLWRGPDCEWMVSEASPSQASLLVDGLVIKVAVMPNFVGEFSGSTIGGGVGLEPVACGRRNCRDVVGVRVATRDEDGTAVTARLGEELMNGLDAAGVDAGTITLFDAVASALGLLLATELGLATVMLASELELATVMLASELGLVVRDGSEEGILGTLDTRRGDADGDVGCVVVGVPDTDGDVELDVEGLGDANIVEVGDTSAVALTMSLLGLSQKQKANTRGDCMPTLWHPPLQAAVTPGLPSSRLICRERSKAANK